MKKLVLIVTALVVGMAGSVAFAKAPYKKDLGLDKCDACHLEDKKAENKGNKLWATAKEHAAKMKEGKGDFAGKTACADCHKGKQKP